MNRFPHLISHERLQGLAAFAGGTALLVTFAVFLSEEGFPYASSGLPAAVCATSPCTAANDDLTLTAAQGSVPPGGSTTLSWGATNLADSTPSATCFGDGTTCSNPTNDSYSQRFQLAVGGSTARPDVFTVGTNKYMLVGRTLSSAGNSYIYKWTASGTYCPVGGGWGNGVICVRDTDSPGAAVYQAIPSQSLVSGEFYLIGSVAYLALPNTTTGRLYIYRWASGSGCPSGGGFGNGVACAASGQSVGANAQQTLTLSSASGAVKYTLGGTHYLFGTAYAAVSNNVLYKWTPSGSGCPALGGWGNGTACGLTYQSVRGVYTYQIVDPPFSVGSDTYFAVPSLGTASGNTGFSQIFKWTPAGTSCPTGGGWGNGVVCATSGAANEHQHLKNPFGARRVIPFTEGGTQYLFAGIGGSVASNQYVYRWTPSGANCPTGGGFGNGTTCHHSGQSTSNNAYQTLPSHRAFVSDVYSDNGQPLLSVGDSLGGFYVYSYRWTETGENCPAGGGFGDGTACASASAQNRLQNFLIATAGSASALSTDSIDGTTYLGQTNNYYYYYLFKLFPALCFGNGVSCNAPAQTVTQAGVEDWGMFSVGADSYALVADYSQNIVRAYTVMDTCLGDGSVCATATGGNAIQSLAVPNAWQVSGFTVPAGPAPQGTFIAVSSPQELRIYKWTLPPANGGKGCIGNGTTCGTVFQTLNYSYMNESLFFVSNSQLYLASGYSVEPNQGIIRLFEWSTGSGCGAGGFGNGVTCGVSKQDVNVANSDRPHELDLFTVGATTYLWTTNNDEGNSGNIIYQWMPTQECFGNGTTCGNKHNSWTPGNEHGRDLITYTINGVLYGLNVSFGTNNSDGGAARWMSAQNCFGNGSSCGQYYDTSIGRADALAFYDAGLEKYLAHTYSNGTRIFKWTASGPNCPTGGSWGNGNTCNNQSCGLEECWTHPFQTLSTNASTEVVFASSGSTAHVLTDNQVFSYSASLSACRVYRHTATTGTTTASVAESAINFDTGALSEATTFTLTCTKESGTQESVALTIPLAAVSVSVEGTDTSANETGGNTGTFTLRRAVSSASALVVNYTLSGTATNGVDYQTISSSATIPANQTGVAVLVTPLNDASVEGNETVTLTVAAGAGYTPATAPNHTATVTIVDDESASQVPSITSGMLTVNPTLVRSGSTFVVSWDVIGLTLQNTCTIRSSPNVFSRDYAGGATTWTGSGTSAALTSQTTVTLRCVALDGTSSSVQKLVRLIPSYQER